MDTTIPPAEAADTTGTHPNLAVIAGLREAADFLEQHPELPETYYASLCLRYEGSRTLPARETLEVVARALGDRAMERKLGTSVRIEGRFSGDVDLYAGANPRELADVPPEAVEYRPILPVRDPCPACDGRRVSTGPDAFGNYDPCPACEDNPPAGEAF